MATEDFLGEEITPDVLISPETPEPEGGDISDYATRFNVYGMLALHPEAQLTHQQYQERWDESDKDEEFELLKKNNAPQYKFDLLAESMSRSHYETAQLRHKISAEAEERISHDALPAQLLGTFGMSALDPSVLIPGTLAFKGVKMLLTLKRVAYGAAMGTTASVAQEGLLEQTTGQPADFGSAAFWGATIGGGIFAIGPMIAGGKTAISKAAAKAFVEPSDMEKIISGELPVTQVDENHFSYIDANNNRVVMSQAGVGLEPQPIWFETPVMNKYITPFVFSPISRLTKSKYPLFNRLGSMLETSPVARTINGKIHKEGTTAQGIKQRLAARKGEAKRHLWAAHREAQLKYNYKRDFRQYESELGDILDDISENVHLKAHQQLLDEIDFIKTQSEISLANLRTNSQNALNRKIKTILQQARNNGDKADYYKRHQLIEQHKQNATADLRREIKEFKEQLHEHQITIKSRNYSTRLNEILREMHDSLDTSHIDPKYVKGIEAYHKYNVGYAERMRALKMKGSEDLFPLLYKTRSWNLEAIASKNKEELREIISNAFYNDPYNKILLDNKKMSRRTAEKRINIIIEHMEDISLIRDLPDNTLTVPRSMPLGQFTKHRQFSLNDKYLEDLIDRGLTDIMETYNYQMSGRVALHTQFGTDDLTVLRDEILKPASKEAKRLGATDAERNGLAEDFNTLVEQILGIHGLPEKPNFWGEKLSRMLMKWNYLTFGGGFGINALADMGVVVFTNGLKNTLLHFGDSLKAIRNMSELHPEIPWIEQAIGLGAASDFYAARSLSRFADMDTMHTSTKIERAMDSMSLVMGKFSGLQHITALEELLAIGGGTVDIIKTAQKFVKTGKLPRGFKEKLGRYGLDENDLKWIASQPVKMKDGKLYDFNWANWTDKQQMEKFQTAITKVMNDAVIRGEKTLLPNYMTSKNPFTKLITQFLRYPHIAHERILLRAANKPTARFLTGTMTSAALMASIYYIREQALIAAGLIDNRDAKYAIFDEYGNFDDDAMNRLGWTVAMKMPQLGILTDAIGKGRAAVGEPLPGRYFTESLGSSLAGISGQRIETINKVLTKLWDGTGDSMEWYYMTKSLIPFQNLLQIDQFYNPMVKELIK